MTEQEIRVRTRVLPGVRASLAALQVRDIDAGAASLAVRYAELLDEAVAAQKYQKALQRVGRAIDLYSDNLPATAREELYAAWEKLSSALAEHSVASDLGPKLLSSLAALQLTPDARKAAAAPKEQPAGTAQILPMANPLEELQSESDERWHAARS